MENLLTVQNVMFGVGVLGTIFGVYNYFRSPQVESDKKDALLTQQAQWSKETTDFRFKDLQESFQGLLLQSNNHIHTVDTKVEALSKSVIALSVEVAKLSTIIEERIPRRPSL